MAREPKNKAPTAKDDQEEMTVVILRFKGSGESLQKGFDAVSQAIAALGPPAAPSPRILSARPRELSSDNGTEVIDGETIDEDFEEVAEEEGDTAPRPSNAAPRKRQAYKFLNDLDLKAGDISLKDYCAQKNPKTDNEKYLVASNWLSRYGGHETFTIDHIFTCFRGMGWKQQRDLSQPMRKMKFSKSWFENPERGSWKLTSIGKEAAEAISNQED
jgi:hypothetical protein